MTSKQYATDISGMRPLGKTGTYLVHAWVIFARETTQEKP
jgi:hypothetical protein